MNTERNLRRTVLPNGLIVLTERMEHLRSVAMGVWIKSGSRCEAAEINGISHFVEHMVFKGTRSRSAQHIAREMDSIGGNLDAFTGKETICFNVKSLAEHVPIALDVLADLVLNPVFASTDIERERGVILEEIKIDEDNPDVLVHELFTQNFWKDHPLGQADPRHHRQPWAASISRSSSTTTPAASTAGTWSSPRPAISSTISLSKLSRRSSPALPSGRSRCTNMQAPLASARILLRNKKALEQVQICLGVPAPPITDDNRYATLILNTVLGGGMSSRLFQTIREERGMAYSDLLRPQPLPRHGHALRLRRHLGRQGSGSHRPDPAEFRKLKEVPLSEEELTRAKDQLKGNILMGLESSNSRMANLARQEMYFHQFFTVEEIIARIDAVNRGAGAGHGAAPLRSRPHCGHPPWPPRRHQAEPRGLVC